jgi:hypothetical protein
MKFTKYFKGGISYKSLGTSARDRNGILLELFSVPFTHSD